MSKIAQNLEKVKKNIEKSLPRSMYSIEDITLVAVAKNATLEQIKAINELGIKDIGENIVQKLVPQMKSTKSLDINWHFVGHLQSNKVKYVIDKVHLIHSLERYSLAGELNKRANFLGIEKVDSLVQVNIALEETKYGLHPDEVFKFIEEVLKNYPKVKLKGLMAIAPYMEQSEELRPYFFQMRSLFEKAREEFSFSGDEFDTLSMGMSNDYHIAIEEGSNMVRLGTILFK